MFTGIVENTGTVLRLLRRGGGARLEVRAPWLVHELEVGDSVAVNGACVTVTERNDEAFACDLVPETVARTNLGILELNEDVNLERPVRAADRLGGHIVQGHVDAVGLVRSKRRVGAQEMLEVTIPFELTRYLAPQGSVCVDGVSLTVVAVDRDRFKVALIPHTVAATTLGRKGQGASVNVEVDVISKYVERHLAVRNTRPTGASLFEDPPRERPDPMEAGTLPPARPVAPRPKPVQHGDLPPARKAAPRAAAARKQPTRSTAAKRTTAARSTTQSKSTQKPGKRRR